MTANIAHCGCARRQRISQRLHGLKREIIAAGGALGIATDCNPGTAWCESMPLVMALATRYMRLTPAEALAAGTINSAFAIGMADRVGSLEAGKQADLLIIDTPDYRHVSIASGPTRCGRS